MKLAFNLVFYHIPIAHIGWSFKMTGLSHTCIADKLQCVSRLTSGLCSAPWLLVYKAPNCFNHCNFRTNTFGNLKGLHSSFFLHNLPSFFSQINYRISCLVKRNCADNSVRISLNENLKFLQHWDFVSGSMYFLSYLSIIEISKQRLNIAVFLERSCTVLVNVFLYIYIF